MKRLHVLFTLNSLALIFVSVERFSVTTRILLQPFDFLRLHEAVQITVLILATVLLPFFILREVTADFSLLKGTYRKNLILGAFFIAGIYFYASGNAYHELASFLLNQYCSVTKVEGVLCQGLFFNDYYVGNGLYFIGAFLITVVPILIEVDHPRVLMTGRDLLLLLPNALIYSLAIIAYAGFDRVLVGLVYSVITTFVVLCILLLHRNSILHFPVTLYAAIAYSVGLIVAFLVRVLV
ncbi:MAG: hypothetical protein IMW89_17160 [Ktedonobacteraceae bacterium]|nr:hypothetical protein [Ktedonobacteraceae bacterium]